MQSPAHDPAGGAPDAPLWEPMPLEGDEIGPAPGPAAGGGADAGGGPCWACQSLSLSAPTGKLEGLVRLFRDSVGLVSDRELASMLSRYHEEHIRGPAEEIGEEVIPWPPEVAYAHVVHHLLEPTLAVNEQIRTLRGLIRELRKSIRKRNVATGETQVDHKTVELLLKSQKALLEAYGKQPKTMLFYAAEAKLDEGQAGAMLRTAPKL